MSAMESGKPTTVTDAAESAVVVAAAEHPFFGETIVISQQTHFRPPEIDEKNRAVHVIRLGALRHNYQYVESAAARQRCSVISVIKADGYGHGAHATALHLADCCGADAFAVATLEEAVSLRKAFEQNPPGCWTKQLTSSFQTKVSQIDGRTTVSTLSTLDHETVTPSGVPFHHVIAARCRRPLQIRIIVLGPPVGFPHCFNDYLFHGIEVMVSGREVAQALITWVANEKERKSVQVERAARETKERALLPIRSPLLNGTRLSAVSNETEKACEESVFYGMLDARKPPMEATNAKRRPLPHPSSTLSNVSGQDLAREVRAMLLTQKAATEAQDHEAERPAPATPLASGLTSTNPSRANSTDNSISSWSEENSPTGVRDSTKAHGHNTKAAIGTVPNGPSTVHAFCGIEAAAKLSRSRELAASEAHPTKSSTVPLSPPVTNYGSDRRGAAKLSSTAAPRKSLKWHAVVDTGMGRLGFQAGPANDKDTVDVIQELVNAEVHSLAPIEFYGVCTHMADANSPTSTYTQSQMNNFVTLLHRIREAGISIPTVSSDNSAALLSTSLTHFDPDLILTQPNVQTRGFVRTGGAIFGQRPAFKELQAVSTLVTSVRHVNVIKEGQSVGYDRAYVAPYDIRIATLSVGFADGLPRDLGNGKGHVAINSALFNIVGKVCMDMVMVELNKVTDIEGPGSKVVVGDTAVLWGPYDEDQGEGLVRLQDVATSLETTQSALTCGLSIRVSRQYV